MKGWTQNDQQQLDELLRRKDRAHAGFNDSVNKLLDDCGYVIINHPRTACADLLCEHGQQVLDVLIEFFEPSPKPAAVVSSHSAPTNPAALEAQYRDLKYS